MRLISRLATAAVTVAVLGGPSVAQAAPPQARAVTGQTAAKAKRQLVASFQSAWAINVSDGRYPAPQRLARMLARTKPSIRYAVASTAKAATKRNVVYVVVAGTGTDDLTLAQRDSDGKLHVLTAHRFGSYQIH